MGIQPTQTCFFCLAAFLSPLDNFLILIYWFNFWLAMVVVMMQIYPRKTGYFGNSLMLTHCTWILDPICPNQPQQARNWQQASSNLHFLSTVGTACVLFATQWLISETRSQGLSLTPWFSPEVIILKFGNMGLVFCLFDLFWLSP